jgi:catechol 2,3-dioxygenase-like lactoylglutathione lyase family enzyme
MEPRISIVTIAVDDLDRMAAFYEAMGLVRHRIKDGVAFFQMGGSILGLFPRRSAEEDSGLAFGTAPPRVYLAHNTRSDAEVDAVLAEAEKAGGRIVKPAQRLLGRMVRLFRRSGGQSLGSRPQSRFPDRCRRPHLTTRMTVPHARMTVPNE